MILSFPSSSTSEAAFRGAGFQTVWYMPGRALVHLGTTTAARKRVLWTKDEARAWLWEAAGVRAESVLMDMRFASPDERVSFRTLARRLRRKGRRLAA